MRVYGEIVDLGNLGSSFFVECADLLTHEIIHLSPVEYIEQNRYLPSSVTSQPGPVSHDVNPYMREILNCADPRCDVREVNVLKGAQVTYSTITESVVMYFADYVGNMPMMYLTADKGLANTRVENNFLPMFQQSGLSHIIRSNDTNSAQKTGQTKDLISFAKGGYLVPYGVNSPGKLRSHSIAVMIKDEVDGWKQNVGKDGNPDKLTDTRTDGYTDVRKVFRGSTPLLRHNSLIWGRYLEGDQRKYFVPCKHCGRMQPLKWHRVDKETGLKSGFVWDYHEDGTLDLESVRYLCMHCQGPHYEYDKMAMFSGGEWRATATPISRDIRSYHLPSLYSPVGMKPWYRNVQEYIACYDVKTNRVTNIEKYQVFYNNVLGEPFDTQGTRLTFRQVSAHRKRYPSGTVPNTLAVQYTNSRVLFLTCQVDVHKDNLAVAVMGWTENMRCFVIEYDRFYAEDGEECSNIDCKAWQQLRDTIENKEYRADDGAVYKVAHTFVDAGFCQSTVTDFCAEYAATVYPVVGRTSFAKTQLVKEFDPYTTRRGTMGFRLSVNMYKDRLGAVLRQHWHYDEALKELQPWYGFNTPMDTTDEQIKELAAEYVREETDKNTGQVKRVWYRPSGADNELWDLLVYGNANVEVFAWMICTQIFELETVEWPDFWRYASDPANNSRFARVDF